MSNKDIVNRFWEYYFKNKLGSNSISMFFYLLDVFEKNRKKTFCLSDGKLSEGLSVSRNTVKSVRQKLVDLELIQVFSQNGKSPRYIILEKIDNSVMNEIISVADHKKGKDSAILEEIIVAEKKISEDPKIEIKSNATIPPVEEFLNFAKTLSNYDESLNLLIEKKYKQWKDIGWKNAQNRPITDWKVSLKAAIPFLKNDEKDKIIPSIKRP